MKLKEGGFEFRDDEEEGGWSVHYRRREIGHIVGMKEASGRHCFRLGCDMRKEPRTYRGKVKAAQALLSLSDLQRNAKKKNWSMEEVILRAWDCRPTVSDANA